MNTALTNIPDLQYITGTLANYSKKLAHCIHDQQWEELLVTLDRRQQYFETLDAHAEALKAAGFGEHIKQILHEDDIFIKDVMQQKAKVEQEHLALMHSRQAVKAYQ